MRDRISGLTIALAGLLVLHAVLITLALHLVFGVPRVETLAHHVDLFLASTQSNDSWKPMETARRFAAEQPQASIYEEVFFRRGVKFQYPPSALLFIDHLGRRALNAISWTAVWVTVLASVFLFDRSLRGAGWRPRSMPDAWLRLAVGAGLGLSFYPLLKAYSLGQIQVWIDAIFAVLVVTSTRSPAIGGACLGLIALIKPQFGLVAVWAATRRQWRFLSGFGLVALAGLIVSIATFGLYSHLDYLRTLTYIGSRGEAFYANQSFNGLLNRLLFNGDNLVWQETTFAPPHPGVQIGTSIAACVLMAAALVLPRRPDRGGVMDLALVSLTVTVVSPVAWEHHYGILLPLFAATVGDVLAARPLGRSTAAALAIAFVLTGQFFQPLQRFATSALNVVQSYVLFGALLLLALWYGTLRRGRENAGRGVR